MITGVDPVHQLFIMARLTEFSRYDEKTRAHERDPWAHMRKRLQLIEPVLAALKGQALAVARAQLKAALKAGALDEKRCGEFKELFERLLSRGDFVDAAIHLSPGADARTAATLDEHLSRAKPVHIFQLERLPPDARDPNWDRVVEELYARLNLAGLEKIRQRKPLTKRRRDMVLRRLRRNVAEFCTVVRITDGTAPLTPFMLSRIEALIGACLRFLHKNR